MKNDQSLHLNFPPSVVACTTLSTTVSDNNLPVKKRNINETENDLPTNKIKRSSRNKKKLMNLIKIFLPIKENNRK